MKVKGIYLIIFLFFFSLFLVDLVSAQTTYTPSTETHCTGGKCWMALYSGTIFAQNSTGDWVDASDVMKITKKSDDLTFHYNGIEGLFNITFEAGTIYNGNYYSFAQVKQLYPEIKFSFPTQKNPANWKYAVNISNLQNLDKTKIENITLTYKDHYGFKLAQLKSEKGRYMVKNTLEILFDDLKQRGFIVNIKKAEKRIYISNITLDKFDGDSLYLDPTIMLNETSERTEDVALREANPTRHYGAYTYLQIDDASGAAWRSAVKFNLSKIPSGQQIDAATLYAYVSYHDTDLAISVYHCLNESLGGYWDEHTALIDSGATLPYWSWNLLPCGTGFDNAVQCNLTAQDAFTSTGTGWADWDVFNAVKTDYDASEDNVTLIWKSTTEGNGGGLTQFHSGDYATDTTLRPYLNVTYSAAAILNYTKITLTLNGTAANYSAGTYPASINVTAKLNITGHVELYHNGTLINNQSSVSFNDTIWGAGNFHNFTAVYISNGTHEASSATFWANISKGDTSTNLLLNGTDGNEAYAVNTAANFTVVVNTTGLTVKLDSNYTGWAIQSGTTPLMNYTTLTSGGIFWNMTGYFEANENYTKSSETHYFNVTIIKLFQWVQTYFTNDTHIRYNLTIWAYNNNTNTLTNIRITPDTMFSGTYYTISSLASSAENQTVLTNITTRPIGADNVLNISVAVASGGAGGTSNAIGIVNPIDPPSKVNVYSRNASDSSTLSDTPDRDLTAERDTESSISFAGFIDMLVKYIRNAFDSATSTITASRTFAALRYLYDTLTHAVSTSRMITALRYAYDAVTGSESTDRTTTITRNVEDSFTASVFRTMLINMNRFIFESSAATFSSDRDITMSRDVQSTVTASESVRRPWTLERYFSDSLTFSLLQDATADYLKPLFDSITGTPSTSRGVSQTRNIYDTATNTISTSRTATWLRYLYDAFTSAFGGKLSYEFLFPRATTTTTTTVPSLAGGGGKVGPTLVEYNVFCEPEAYIGGQLKCSVFIFNPSVIDKNVTVDYYIAGSQREFSETLPVESQETIYHTIYVPIDSTTIPSVLFFEALNGTEPVETYNAVFVFEGIYKVSEEFRLVGYFEEQWGWLAEQWYLIFVPISLVIIVVAYKKYKKARAKRRVHRVVTTEFVRS